MSEKKDIQDARKQTDIETVFFQTRIDKRSDITALLTAHKRAERIAAVTYLLTRKVSDKEPLKAKLREGSHSLIESTLALSAGFRTPYARGTTEEIEQNVLELMTGVRLLVLGGFTSRANAELLIQALDELALFVSMSKESGMAEGVHISRSDLIPNVSSPETSVASPVSLQRVDQKISKPRTERARTEPHTQERERHTTRRETILAVLRKNGPLGIKDISVHCTDCGEKTVQRELSALVEEGFLRKIGEKRWSRYSII